MPPPTVGPSFAVARSSRTGLANYLLHHGPVLRRRIVSKLRHLSIHGVDPDDVLSSVLRRIDLMAVRQVLRVDDERELWACAIGILDRVILERLRAARTYHRICGPEGSAVRHLASRFGRCDGAEETRVRLYDMITFLDRSQSRELLFLRLQGLSYVEIAAATGDSEVSLRQRFVRTCRELRRRFPDDRQTGLAGTERTDR